MSINYADHKYPGSEGNDLVMKSLIAVFFLISMVAMTVVQVKRVNKVHQDKNEYGYKFAPNDLRFDSMNKIVKLSIFCLIAASLCGFTGIAGGMVLGPLFLSYNMVPQVMAGTNQYITMIASLVTVLQFMLLGDLLWNYAILFGTMTIVAAYCGLKSLNVYIARSGKQSVIAIVLAICLGFALLSLPLKYII